MLLSVVANLGMLGYFKYGTVPARQLRRAAARGRHALPARARTTSCCRSGSRFIPLPPCPTRSTSICAARSRRENFLDYALFVTFFPHLVAGPIMRPTELVPQFAEPRRASADQLRFGLALMTLGLFKKVVLADSFLAPAAERVYDSDKMPGVLDAWAGDARLQRPDLLRFRRLFDHRDRRRAVPGLRHARQLPLSLRRGRFLGFLAALAHHAVVLAARLPVHPARRQPPRRSAAPTSR